MSNAIFFTKFYLTSQKYKQFRQSVPVDFSTVRLLIVDFDRGVGSMLGSVLAFGTVRGDGSLPLPYGLQIIPLKSVEHSLSDALTMMVSVRSGSD